MAIGHVGNLKSIADSHTEMFGGPAFVAAGRFGDSLWTNIGLVMRVSITRSLFSQSVINEVMQTMGQSNFQTFSKATVSMTLRRFQVEQMAALYPSIIKSFASSSTMQEGLGHSTTPTVITPVGLHIRPQYSYGEAANDGSCWWIPAAVASSELGEFIFKLENTAESNEDFTLGFEASLITQDYTPGTKQNIEESGQILYRGDTRHIVTTSWEDRLPFGYVQGTAGRVESFEVSTNSSGSVEVEWTAPGSAFIESGFPVTAYQVRHRVKGDGAFTDLAEVSASATLEATVASTAGNTLEIRVAAKTSAGLGQEAALEVVVA